MSDITLSASTIGVGGVAQGTVTVNQPVASTIGVALTSSNGAVATVQPVTISPRSNMATFTVTGVAPGTMGGPGLS